MFSKYFKISVMLPSPVQSFGHLPLEKFQPEVNVLLGLDILDRELIIIDKIEKLLVKMYVSGKFQLQDTAHQTGIHKSIPTFILSVQR